jgi:hypothetical protein
MLTITRTPDGCQINCDDDIYCSLIAQAAHAVGRLPMLRNGGLAGLLDEHGKLVRELSNPQRVRTNAEEVEMVETAIEDMPACPPACRPVRRPPAGHSAHTAELIGAPVGAIAAELVGSRPAVCSGLDVTV